MDSLFLNKKVLKLTAVFTKNLHGFDSEQVLWRSKLRVMCSMLILPDSQGTSFYVKYFKETQVICSTGGRMLCANILPTFLILQ